MTTDQLMSWAMDRPVDASPFALPKGYLGRLAGRVMLFTNKQTDQLALLDPKPGSRVLEVGFGPGGLVRAMLAAGATVFGVDLSPEMVAAAGKRNPAASLREGSAASTGYPDAHFDHVVSVNNVAIWPDLEAGLRELHRVVRPGGTVLICWHGGTNTPRIARRLRLSNDKLERIRGGLAALFGSVTRHELRAQTAFLAVR
jgi:ubiquinone/menaquinone biosynthesis C-methylase UbiE